MANADPWQGRKARQEHYRSTASADLDHALVVLRLCLARNQEILQRTCVPDEAIFRASHATSQVASAVGKLVDAIELSARLREVEEKLDHAYKPRLVKNSH